jgi:preprotein translocase subunit SecB
MKPSPLQLERHFFTRVLLEAHLDGKREAANHSRCEVEVGQATDNPKRFQLIMRFWLLSPPDKKSKYTGEFHAVGLFRVADAWPKEKEMELVQANGAALLFGAIRELISNLTARGPWPQVTLASVTFVDSKLEQVSKKTEKAAAG